MCIIEIVLETWKRTLLTKEEGPLLTNTEYLKVGCLSQSLGLSFCAALSKEHFQKRIPCPSPRYCFSVAAVSALLLEKKWLMSVSSIPLAPSG